MNRHILSTRHKRNDSNMRTGTTCHVCCCGKQFTQTSNLSRHRKNCNSYKNVETTSDSKSQTNPTNQILCIVNENREMKEQIRTLRNRIEVLIDSRNTTNNHIQTQNNIETQNVIVVNSFGNENTEYLTDQIISRLIQTGPFTCLPKIIERIHFDPEHPENHNIKVTNQKNNYAKIVKDNKWVTANKKQAIDTMIQNGYGLLEEKYQDNKDTISEFKQERFEDFQEKYADQDKDLMKTIKDEVDIALLNGTGKLHKQ